MNALSGNIATIATAWTIHVEKRYRKGQIPSVTSVGPHAVLSWQDGSVIGFTDSNELLVLNGQGGSTTEERLKNYFGCQ